MDSSSEIIKMLTDFHLDPKNEEVRSYFERDNMWRILDIQRYEPSHSAFLAWFFNLELPQYPQVRSLLHLLISKADNKILTNGWNETNDMEDFRNAVLTGGVEIKSVTITPELMVNKISKIRYADRIDLFFRCDVSIVGKSGEEQSKTLEIIIENKVDSIEGDKKDDRYIKGLSNLTPDEEEYKESTQTKRYYLACSKEHRQRIKKDDVDYQLFVFLTPEGTGSESDNYILLKYQDLVDAVFENYLQRKDVDPQSRTLVEAYLHNLGNPFNKQSKSIIAMTNEERELLVEFYERNEALFKTMIQAKIGEAKASGDEEVANAYVGVMEGLNTAAKDNTKYSIIGINGKISKAHLASKAVEAYINDHENITIQQVEEAFNDIRNPFIIKDQPTDNIKHYDEVHLGNDHFWIPNNCWGANTPQFNNLIKKLSNLSLLQQPE